MGTHAARTQTHQVQPFVSVRPVTDKWLTRTSFTGYGCDHRVRSRFNSCMVSATTHPVRSYAPQRVTRQGTRAPSGIIGVIVVSVTVPSGLVCCTTRPAHQTHRFQKPCVRCPPVGDVVVDVHLGGPGPVPGKILGSGTPPSSVPGYTNDCCWSSFSPVPVDATIRGRSSNVKCYRWIPLRFHHQ